MKTDNIFYGKQTIEKDDVEALSMALMEPLITTGPKTLEFETKLAEYCDAKYCIAVANGTIALHLASLCLLDAGDKVLTTPNSFLSTSNAILYVGAKPIFVDICEDGNIDLDLCEKMLLKNPDIKAIYVVSFSGNMVNQEKLAYLKKKYEIKILEDNAHAIGAVYDGIKAGSCVNSDASIFSFHPVKNMTTGEGGAITTNNEEMYKLLLSLRTHGVMRTDDLKPWEYNMVRLGYNGRITDFQCALGLSQLKKLLKFIDKRIKIAKQYDSAFENTIIKPLYRFNGKSAYHLYVVRINFKVMSLSKVELYNILKEKYGITLQIHYMPINKQPYYRELGYGHEYTPVMDRYYEECLSLPIYPKLSDDEQKYVIASLFEVLNG